MTKAELVKLIKENFYNEEDNMIDLRELKFDCNVSTNQMEVKGDLYQSWHKVDGNLFQSLHEVKGNLYQGWHKVDGDLHQDWHKVDGDLYQNSHEVGGKITEGEHKKRLKKITKEELEKLGYRLED